MRRIVLTVLLIVLMSAGLAAQQAFQELSVLLDMEATLKAVNNDSELLENLISDGRLVLFTGTVASRTLISGEEEEFLGELELIDGEWYGTEAVAMYKAYLRLEGSEYAGTIPARRSREKNPNEIETNTNFIVIGEVIESREEESGLYPVIRVRYLRRI
jgi:hypothetical protein